MVITGVTVTGTIALGRDITSVVRTLQSWGLTIHLVVMGITT